VLQPHQAERAIRLTRALIERAAYNKKLTEPPRIAYDEWNVWFRTEDGALEERYTFPDALAVATYLNIFIRNCAWVKMANLAHMVNAIAPIVTSPATTQPPIYYPILLHATTALEIAADVYVTGPTVSLPGANRTNRWPHQIADLGPFSLVDAAATMSASRDKAAVALVNRSPGKPETAVLELRDMVFDGPARIRCLTAEREPATRILPDVEGACLEEGQKPPRARRSPSPFPRCRLPSSRRRHSIRESHDSSRILYQKEPEEGKLPSR
jgi:alpha-L-arabinofuranosidase